MDSDEESFQENVTIISNGNDAWKNSVCYHSIDKIEDMVEIKTNLNSHLFKPLEEYRKKNVKKNKDNTKSESNVRHKRLNRKDLHAFLSLIENYRRTIVYDTGIEEEIKTPARITVCTRKRPISDLELSLHDIDVVTVPDRKHCIVHTPKTKFDLRRFIENHEFRFDYAFDEYCSNAKVYEIAAKPLVETVVRGKSALCFAYGQTGSGKTYTMCGDTSQKPVDYTKGITFMAINDLFEHATKELNQNVKIKCSFVEIYCGKVFDLLSESKKELMVLEDERGVVNIKNKKENEVTSPKEAMDLIQYGMTNRHQGITSSNEHSSRSHSVFQISLMVGCQRYSSLSLVDLAGNERARDNVSDDALNRFEGAEINKSLLALKECVRALGRDENSHVPFRGSILTKVLRDSLIKKNSIVCMIAMLSPGGHDVENTLNTLHYADRVKELRVDKSVSRTLKATNFEFAKRSSEYERKGYMNKPKVIFEEFSSFPTCETKSEFDEEVLNDNCTEFRLNLVDEKNSTRKCILKNLSSQISQYKGESPTFISKLLEDNIPAFVKQHCFFSNDRICKEFRDHFNILVKLPLYYDELFDTFDSLFENPMLSEEKYALQFNACLNKLLNELSPCISTKNFTNAE